MRQNKGSLPNSLLSLYPCVYQSTMTWRRALRPLPYLIIIPLGFLLPAIFSRQAGLVEYFYSSGVYPHIQQSILSISERIPFSLAELVLYALVVLVPLSLLLSIGTSIRRRAAQYFVRRVLSLCLIFGIGLNLFYLTWGFNYFREPLSKRMGLAVQQHSTEELALVLEVLGEETADLRDALPLSADGTATYTTAMDDTLYSLIDCYQHLGDVYPALSGHVSQVKPVFFSKGLSSSGIGGIYIGLTAEANINADQPAFSIPHAAAHEMAHQLGIASEDEAEFTAFLASLCSDDPFVRYSGVLQMLIRCGNALNRVDADAYQEVRSGYSEGVLTDLIAQAAYWKSFEGPVSEAADQMNDRYLKHNGKASGVQSYGEAVDLVLSWFYDQK